MLFVCILSGFAVCGQSIKTSKDSTTAVNKTDTGLLKKSLPIVPNPLRNQKNPLASPLAQVKSSSNKFSQVDSNISRGLKKLKPQQIKVDLSLENAVQYHPASDLSGIGTGQQYADKFYIRGTVSAFGIPLNLDFTNDHNNFSGLGDLRSSLFKFDYSPAQLNGLLKSDLQQYYDVRRNAFAGRDLTGYTQKVLQDKLKAQKVNGTTNPGFVSQYLDKPTNVTELLGMNEQQIKQKLQKEADAEAKRKEAGAGNLKDAAMRHTNKLSPDSVNRSAQYDKAVKDLSADKNLTQYFGDAKQASELKVMNPEQIRTKLSAMSPPMAAPKLAEKDDAVPLLPFTGFKLSAFMASAIKEKNAAHAEAIHKLSDQVFSTRISGGSLNYNSLLEKAAKQPTLQAAIPSTDITDLRHTDKKKLTSRIREKEKEDEKLRQNKQIDSVAHTITALKSQLQGKGVDVKQMLAIQKAMGEGSGEAPNEMVNGLISKKPQNGLQSFFTRMQALKIGSFGNNALGSTQNSDIFMEGTHLTYKAGSTPITLGYGSMNDIASAKDANYTSSDYNSPRSLTYASIKVNRGVFGSTKFSVIGSVGNISSNYNSAYTVPVSPSNNVALTISKFFNAGDIGKFTFDVSKSTTLNYNNTINPTDAVMDQKAGLNYNNQSNLIEGMSFGVNHQLELKNEGLNETAYFNYAGSGYQNPGNNGLGGGSMKVGGNVKKTLFKNKLQLAVRTDLSDRSISYTSNDQWKTYQVQLDTRYMFSRKFNVSLKYINNGTDKQTDNITSSVYSSQKYQVDGNASYKIGRNYTVSHLTIGKQDYTNTYLTGGGSSMLMVNYTQSLLLHKNSLTATVFYNKELTSTSLIGNLVNSDLTYQYAVFRSISMGSGVTYLENAGTAKQAGIRQTIQLFAGKNFDVDTYLDLRRNLIVPLYPELYSACRAQLSLKYHLKD